MGQIDHRPGVENVVVPDDAGEDGVPARLMRLNALPLVESVDAGKAADLPVEPLPVVKTEIRAVYGALSGRLFWFLAV